MKPEGSSLTPPQIRRLASVDLKLRRDRVKNLIRIINICDLLPLMAFKAGRYGDAEFFTISRCVNLGLMPLLSFPLLLYADSGLKRRQADRAGP